MDPLTDWFTAVGTVVAALAAVVAAWMAKRAADIAQGAANTWRDTLQNQRTDECIAAASDLQASINRCISAAQGRRRNEIWPTYSDAWEHQTKFRGTYLVARRYRQSLNSDVPVQIDALLNRLRLSCLSVADGGNCEEKEVSDIQTGIGGIVSSVRTQLG